MLHSTGPKHNIPKCGSLGVKVTGVIDKGHPVFLSSGELPTAFPQGLHLTFPFSSLTKGPTINSFPAVLISTGWECCHWRLAGPVFQTGILDWSHCSLPVTSDGVGGAVTGAGIRVDGPKSTSWSCHRAGHPLESHSTHLLLGSSHLLNGDVPANFIKLLWRLHMQLLEERTMNFFLFSGHSPWKSIPRGPERKQ